MTDNNHKNTDKQRKKDNSTNANTEVKEVSNSLNAETDNDYATENNNPEVQKEKEHESDNLETISKQEEEIELLKEEKLRLLAEMENLRKRSEKDKLDSIRYGSVNLAREILSISDNLGRALESANLEKNKSEPVKQLIDGLNMVQKEFMSILKKHGVEKIEALQKKFNHNLHQAVIEVETNEHEEGLVVQEIQTGFTMHERLLRPAMVGVSKKAKNSKKE